MNHDASLCQLLVGIAKHSPISLLHTICSPLINLSCIWNVQLVMRMLVVKHQGIVIALYDAIRERKERRQRKPL